MVVATPRRWTVQVIVDGNTVALGTIVDTDGFVLTKASELTDGPIRCRLFDGRTVDAAWTAAHPDHDIAMLKIDADGLTAAEWASEVDPRPGQWLATPGLTRIPVSVGIVSTAPHNIKEVHVAGVLGVELEREKEAARIKAITPNSGADDARPEAWRRDRADRRDRRRPDPQHSCRRFASTVPEIRWN